MPPHFDLDHALEYRAWRDRKLEAYPRSAAELVVEVADPCRLSTAERDALLDRCARANMAIYATARGNDEPKAVLRSLCAQLGLHTLDPNYLADDDGISPIADAQQDGRGDYIPYTNRAIGWHTDGYYNPPQLAIRAMVLHCVERAEHGGDNHLLDHELAYVALRDEDPQFVHALMRADAMTIPARAEAGAEARAAQSGPVFSVADGALQMRYTARTRSIEWKRDTATAAAVGALARMLKASPFVLRVRLEPGMGIVCNNVLHDRTAFEDSPARHRLILRARFYERIRDRLAVTAAA